MSVICNAAIRACIPKDSHALLCWPQGSFDSKVISSLKSFYFVHSHLKVLSELQVERNNRKARSKWEKKFANMTDTSHCEKTKAERR